MLLLGLGFAGACNGGACNRAPHDPELVLETTQGKITVRLYGDKAPKFTRTVLANAADGFYNGTVFHRAIPEVIIAAGLYDHALVPRESHQPIVSDDVGVLMNRRGTVAMGRDNTTAPITGQLTINVGDNSSRSGYVVVGEVVEGMDVVDTISQARTICPTVLGQPCPFPIPNGLRDVPEKLVIITKAYRK